LQEVTVMSIPATLFLALLLMSATAFDLHQRRIPNALTFPMMMAGILYFSLSNGFHGFLFSAGGLLLGLFFLLPIHLFGCMGAGDVKLMGAVGSFLGPQGVFEAFLYTAVAGGVYALIVLAGKGALSRTASRYGAMLGGCLGTGQLTPIPPNEGKLPPLCYGLAISLGTVLSVLRPL
jgi:prepilin peptidase CpaA